MKALTSVSHVPYELNPDGCGFCWAVALPLGIEPRPPCRYTHPHRRPRPCSSHLASFRKALMNSTNGRDFENTAKTVSSHKDDEPCNYRSENCIFNILRSSHQANLPLCCTWHLVWVSFYLKEIHKCIIDELMSCMETPRPVNSLLYLIIGYAHSYKRHRDKFLTTQ